MNYIIFHSLIALFPPAMGSILGIIPGNENAIFVIWTWHSAFQIILGIYRQSSRYEITGPKA